ncbi:AMP-binding protein [Rubellicoccus peritrichatus]|uniref:AMP-binding protein n=1 Tax=Rubellicoccus peritrichatus TaxID=3080537 RepID=A0AAQ3LAH2_9BACT|nr:AMP-binding protein [Puniceicoccus sp. CR14]WOO41846.1 AMP-binding protein [Puniceicoccus sp. CR14]
MEHAMQSSIQETPSTLSLGWVKRPFRRISQMAFYAFSWIIVKTLYRIRSKGWDNLPTEGGAVLICNHVSYVDAVLLAIASPRRIRFLSLDTLQKVPVVGTFLRLADVIPVSPERSKDAIRLAVEHAKRGEIVGIFPEGHLTRDGHVHEFQRGYELIARRAGVPVVPVCLDGLWGSIFSFKGGRFFKKWPSRLPYRVSIQVGASFNAREMNPETARQTILDMGADAFAQRPELQGHIGGMVLESLCEDPKRECIVDYSAGRKSLNAGTVAALAICLSKHFKATIPEKRVAVVLPPGLGGALANVALSLAGKIPVNLNFTLGRSALQSCLRRGEIKTIISAAPVKEKIDQKFPDFPWTEHVIDIKKEIDALPKPKLIFWILAGKLLPAKVVASLAGAPKQGGDEEAALLFTSGSDGDPKGVVLTHKNIIANAKQVLACGVFPQNESLMANLPIFHSFGFTVTIWCPLLEKVKVTYTPSPLDFKLAAKAIKQESAGILLGTPTFFRPYLTRVQPEDMASVKIVVGGAEKTPKGFHEAWEERFPNSSYLEGYGLTETSPVASVNIPKEYLPKEYETGMRKGSVGRLFPGMAAEIVDPDTGEVLPIGETGILKLKGANVFNGYLNDPERTAQVLEGDWFTTGDLARLDEEGFLFIEGRLSRFSKMGGEMVPHGTIETAIARVFEVDKAETPQVAVTARVDESKGEALVLVSAIDIEPAELRKRLSSDGLPNLWIPKEIKRVDAIPTLASGKLELAALKKIAAE